MIKNKSHITLFAATIILFCLVTGVFWGTWFALSRTIGEASLATFIQIGHMTSANLAIPMRILMPVSLLVALGCLWCIRDVKSVAFWCVAGAFVLMLGALLVTVLVEVPLDDQMKTWTVANAPVAWETVRDRWEFHHVVRTVLSVGAFVLLVIGALTVRGAASSTSLRKA